MTRQRAYKRRGSDKDRRQERGRIPELFELATEAHRGGDLPRAQELYRRILALQPRHAHAVHLLGFSEFQSSQFTAAIEHLRTAIDIAPKNAEFQNNLALALLAAGDLQAAGHHAMIARQLGHADGHGYFHIGWEFFQRCEPEAAETAFRLSISLQPDNPDALHLLGILLAEQRNWSEAIACYESALRSRPDSAATLNNLGNAYRDQGRPAESIPYYERALAIDPQFAAAHINLGVALAQCNRLDAAILSYDRALRFQPNSFEAVNNLANAFRDLGQTEAAITHYRQALELQPRSGEVLCNLGAAYKHLGKVDESFACFRRAIMLQPHASKIYQHLGAALADSGRLSEAADCYRHLARGQGHSQLWRLRAASCCPSVFSEQEEVDHFLQEWSAAVDQAQVNAGPLSFAELVDYAPLCPFTLQFLPGNLRPLKTRFAQAVRSWLPQLPTPDWIRNWHFSSTLPRIGFVVTEGHEGIFLKSLAGVLQRLSPRWEVVVFCSHRGLREVDAAIGRSQLTVVPLPARLEHCVTTLESAHCDILYYFEVGTDLANYVLPFFRAAPVQVTSWGVQVTSGIPTLDAYLSSQLVEPETAASHYSEALVLADTLLTFRTRQAESSPSLGRAFLPVPADARWYVCAQQIGKFHFDFDPLLAEILRRDPRGRLLITADRFGHQARVLRNRFARNMPDVVDRIHLLPRLEKHQYLSLLAEADVLLDPLHFGGVNSTYDGLAIGKPIVTLPTDQHRGRYTLGCYRKMGFFDCVAVSSEHYVELAVTIASEPDLQRELGRRILEAGDNLFADQGSVAEHERIFDELLERARQGEFAGR